MSSQLQLSDRMGSYKARWGIGRMHYTVDPGLYAFGSPSPASPVFVTANYKMSFDRLREALPGLDGWILALDTRGINVWCAAGKGTFGTEELVYRIQSSGLERIVDHRVLIVPQLGAPGIAAHAVKKASGFKVIYGPVEATDLPAFLAAGRKASPKMRLKTFSTAERIALIPIELVSTLKMLIFVLPVVALICGVTGREGFWTNVGGAGLEAIRGILGAIFAGAVLTPALLPWLPGRAFTWKGLSVGIALALLFVFGHGTLPHTRSDAVEALGWLLLIPSVSAYLAMNFTGASTYTSLSGVQKEMRWAFPFQICLAGVGTCLWLASRFIN